MKWNPKDPVIPVNRKRKTVLDYPEGKDLEWMEVQSFDASLTLVSQTRGRSSVTFWLKDEDGWKYPMFITDLYDLLQGPGIHFGKTPVVAWTFCKRGQNYGIKLLVPETR